MFKIQGQLLKTLLVSIIISQFIGCTIIAPRIGSLIDGSDTKLTYEELEKLIDEKTGKNIVIEKKDNTIIAGKLDLIKTLPDSVYSQNLIRSARNHSIPLPKDSLVISLIDNTEVRGEFSGFNYFSKFTRKTINSSSTYRENKIGESVPVECRLLNNSQKSIPLNKILTLHDINGTEYDCDILRQFAYNHSLPINNMVSLIVDSTIQHVPFDDINMINVKEKKLWKWVGLGAGIASDIILIGFALMAMDGSMMEHSSW